MRYRPPDNRELPKEVFEKRIRNNSYLLKVYDYPDIIIPHPKPEQFQELWQKKCTSGTTVHVEVGCGSGQYLLQLSQRFPEHCFAGFELRYKRIVLAAKKFKKFNCSNILLLKDKGEYLGEYFGESSIDQIHVNFPDPWAKKAQKKHRLLGQDFFQNITSLLRPEGVFLFKTDHHEYFQWVCTVLQSFPQYQIVEQTKNLYQSIYHENNIETEFEQMFKFKSNPEIAYMKVQISK